MPAFPVELTIRTILLLVLAVVSLALRVAAIFMPRASLTVLVLLFGSFMLAEGLASIGVGLWRIPQHGMWLGSFLRGALGLGLGAFALGATISTVTVMSRVSGSWMVASGAIDLGVAARVVRGEGGRLIDVAGGISALAGLFLLVWPSDSPLFLILWIAGYAIVTGILLLVRVTRLV